MKKISFLFAFIILFGFTGFQTGSLHFKVAYKPDSRYNETLEQSSEGKVYYFGSEEFLKSLKGRDVSNPTITKKSSTTKEIFKTGKLTDSIHFPLTMEFVSTESSDGKQVIPDGTIIFGHGTIGNMPVLDSIFSPGMEDETKMVFMKTMAATLSQITFPEKDINVGDSFTHETPLTIPVAGKKIEMNISTVYKLLSISSGLATFDISQHYTMTLDEYTTEGGGSGSGHMVYDISHNFYTNFEENAEMNLTMKTDDFSLKVSTKNTFKQTITFGKN